MLDDGEQSEVFTVTQDLNQSCVLATASFSFLYRFKKSQSGIFIFTDDCATKTTNGPFLQNLQQPRTYYLYTKKVHRNIKPKQTNFLGKIPRPHSRRQLQVLRKYPHKWHQALYLPSKEGLANKTNDLSRHGFHYSSMTCLVKPRLSTKGTRDKSTNPTSSVSARRRNNFSHRIPDDFWDSQISPSAPYR